MAWVLLVLQPRWRVTGWVVSGVVPGLLAVAHAALVAAGFSRARGGYGSLAELRLLFADDTVLLAGWLHYLAFDLLVGRWIDGTAQRDGLPHWSVVPSLLLTSLFGPLGWLLFQIQRRSRLWADGPARQPRWARQAQPQLAAAGPALPQLMVPTLLAHGLDDRQLAGVDVWVKPLKFQLSLGSTC